MRFKLEFYGDKRLSVSALGGPLIMVEKRESWIKEGAVEITFIKVHSFFYW
jgi:hypothetical protein